VAAGASERGEKRKSEKDLNGERPKKRVPIRVL